MGGNGYDGDDLEGILTEVGPRLRLLRQQRGATLAGLPAATGISASWKRSGATSAAERVS